MNVNRKLFSASVIAAVTIGTLAIAPAANAAPAAKTDAPTPIPVHTTVFPPSDPNGKITYYVLDTQGDIAEATVGEPGPIARSLGAVDLPARAVGASPAIAQPSACGMVPNHDLDLLRQGGKSFCFNGQGSTAVTVTNVTEIVTGPHFVADIHWHTPGEPVASNIAIINPNSAVLTGAAHWTADLESLV